MGSSMSLFFCAIAADVHEMRSSVTRMSLRMTCLPRVCPRLCFDSSTAPQSHRCCEHGVCHSSLTNTAHDEWRPEKWLRPARLPAQRPLRVPQQDRIVDRSAGRVCRCNPPEEIRYQL